MHMHNINLFILITSVKYGEAMRKAFTLFVMMGMIVTTFTIQGVGNSNPPNPHQDHLDQHGYGQMRSILILPQQ